MKEELTHRDWQFWLFFVFPWVFGVISLGKLGVDLIASAFGLGETPISVVYPR